VLSRRVPLTTGAALLTLVVLAQPGRAAPPTLAALDPKVVSYYPATGGWTTMWEHWDPDRYRADFAQIARLQANTVRVFVPAALFGFPVPGEPYVERLHQLVGIAAAAGLKVQLTLFDWLDPSEYADIAGSEQWSGALLAPYAGDPRISIVEVRNEIDTTDPTALAWARQLIPYVRSVLGGTVPVTISVSGDDPISSLQTLKGALAGAEPDFYSIHLYGGSGEQAYWTLQAAQSIVAPVPLWFGETGYPTSTHASGYSDLPSTRQAQDAAQAHFLKTVAYAALELGLPPPGIWTLDDFDPGGIPSGDQAPTNQAEYDFGLYRTNGTAKPAVAVVRSIFGSGPPITFNQGFEQAVRTAGGGSFPAEWSGFGSPNAQLAQVDEQPRSGSGDAVVRSLGGYADGTFFVAPIASTPPPGAAAAQASVWVRIRSHGARVRLALEWLDGTETAIATQESPPPGPGRGWKQLTVSGPPPAGARSVRIELVVGNSPGSVWFDDVGFGWS
jgi:exo-beta-1,3-glucanase (GH17 family)